MKLIISKLNVIIDASENIERREDKFGFYVPGKQIVYPFSTGFKIAETEKQLPDDFQSYKYKFENGQIVVNNDYEEPLNIEQQLKLQAKQIEALTLAMLQS